MSFPCLFVFSQLDAFGQLSFLYDDSGLQA
jgi:hypothetical protein